MNLKTVAARAEATTGKADPVTVVLAAEATEIVAAVAAVAMEIVAAVAAEAMEIVAVVAAAATAIVAVEVEVDTGSAVLDVMTSGADRHEVPATDGLLNLIVSLDSTRATRSLQRRQCL